MILYDSGEQDTNRILAIGDKELLQGLSKDTIFGDGTFDKVPKMFYQLYTWHAKIGNSYPPCIYFLLLNKTKETYFRMFGILKLLVPNMAPEKILVDFEKACIKTARLAFSLAEVKFCYFPLCQRLVRKVGSLGLKTEFDCNPEFKLQVKSLTALKFVPI